MRRLPPRNRTDFGKYGDYFRLPVNGEYSDFALLGSTEAKLPSDGFSLTDPLDPNIQQCELMLEIAGYRYYALQGASVGLGMRLDVVAEPRNPFDPNAVMFCASGTKVGNVNRLQTKAFHSWLSGCVLSVTVERVNGTEERPRAFVFVRVSAGRSLKAA